MMASKATVIIQLFLASPKNESKNRDVERARIFISRTALSRMHATGPAQCNIPDWMCRNALTLWPLPPGAGVKTGPSLSQGQCPVDSLRFPVYDDQERSRRAIGHTAPLLPILHGIQL
jgi:hypothetical protein